MPTLIELRPKRDLLNPNFNGYKLSLDPVPVFRHLLDIATTPGRGVKGEEVKSFGSLFSSATAHDVIWILTHGEIMLLETPKLEESSPADFLEVQQKDILLAGPTSIK
uniref:Uncharacterized protein n=1 Tax=Timema tahoe TaxID=61484 RepID=A0A7R9FM17_9NEOP|nr:unnamed protein product [Timema tahoe]